MKTVEWTEKSRTEHEAFVTIHGCRTYLNARGDNTGAVGYLLFVHHGDVVHFEQHRGGLRQLKARMEAALVGAEKRLADADRAYRDARSMVRGWADPQIRVGAA